MTHGDKPRGGLSPAGGGRPPSPLNGRLREADYHVKSPSGIANVYSLPISGVRLKALNVVLLPFLSSQEISRG